MALRREVFMAALPIPRFVPMHDMWLGAVGCAAGRVYYIPLSLLQYRRHGGNVSPSTHQGWLKMLGWRVKLVLALFIRSLKILMLRQKIMARLNLVSKQ
jgi:hypothetical protein